MGPGGSPQESELVLPRRAPRRGGSAGLPGGQHEATLGCSGLLAARSTSGPHLAGPFVGFPLAPALSCRRRARHLALLTPRALSTRPHGHGCLSGRRPLRLVSRRQVCPEPLGSAVRSGLPSVRVPPRDVREKGKAALSRPLCSASRRDGSPVLSAGAERGCGQRGSDAGFLLAQQVPGVRRGLMKTRSRPQVLV